MQWIIRVPLYTETLSSISTSELLPVSYGHEFYYLTTFSSFWLLENGLWQHTECFFTYLGGC